MQKPARQQGRITNVAQKKLPTNTLSISELNDSPLLTRGLLQGLGNLQILQRNKICNQCVKRIVNTI